MDFVCAVDLDFNFSVNVNVSLDFVDFDIYADR